MIPIWIIFAAPAAVGLFVGLWRGSKSSAKYAAILTIAALSGIAVSLVVTNGPFAEQFFFVTLCLAACAGGFVGPALMTRRCEVAVIISLIAAPLFTFFLFVVAASLACSFHGACF